jgi:hypothetical protein
METGGYPLFTLDSSKRMIYASVFHAVCYVLLRLLVETVKSNSDERTDKAKTITLNTEIISFITTSTEQETKQRQTS